MINSAECTKTTYLNPRDQHQDEDLPTAKTNKGIKHKSEDPQAARQLKDRSNRTNLHNMRGIYRTIKHKHPPKPMLIRGTKLLSKSYVR